MVAAFKEMPELARVAVDPFLPVRSKANIVHAILKDSGATEITQRLFGERAEGLAVDCASSSTRTMRLVPARCLRACRRLPPLLPTTRTTGALADENALAATLQVSAAFDELMLADRKSVV